jgi:hypothetical protein
VSVFSGAVRYTVSSPLKLFSSLPVCTTSTVINAITVTTYECSNFLPFVQEILWSIYWCSIDDYIYVFIILLRWKKMFISKFNKIQFGSDFFFTVTKFFTVFLIHSVGRAIAQVVSRRLPTAAARVQTRVWSCGILWWTKVALGHVFSENFGFPTANLHSIFFSTIIFTITWGWHNRPGVATVPIASQTKLKKKENPLSREQFCIMWW